MNNQLPYGFNPMNQVPSFPNQNYNQVPNINENLNYFDQRIKTLENKVANIEKKLNMNTNDITNGYNPYMSSMHMM